MNSVHVIITFSESSGMSNFVLDNTEVPENQSKYGHLTAAQCGVQVNSTQI